MTGRTVGGGGDVHPVRRTQPTMQHNTQHGDTGPPLSLQAFRALSMTPSHTLSSSARPWQPAQKTQQRKRLDRRRTRETGHPHGNGNENSSGVAACPGHCMRAYEGAHADVYCFACRFAARVSMMWCTPCGSSTTFVPSHRALLVNSEQSSLMSRSCVVHSATVSTQASNGDDRKSTHLELRIARDAPPRSEHLHVLVTLLRRRERAALAHNHRAACLIRNRLPQERRHRHLARREC